jgi:hypothetical protein
MKDHLSWHCWREGHAWLPCLLRKKRGHKEPVPGAAEWWAAIANQTRFLGPKGEVYRMVAIDHNLPVGYGFEMKWPYEVTLELEQTIEQQVKGMYPGA